MNQRLTPKQIAGLVALAVAARPDRSMDPDMVANTAKLWQLTAIGLLPYDLAEAAVVRVIEASPYFPQPADILAAAERVNEHVQLRAMALATERAMKLAGEWVEPPQIDTAQLIPGERLNPGVVRIMQQHNLLPAPRPDATGEGAA